MKLRPILRGLALAFLLAAACFAQAATIEATQEASSGAVIYTDQGSEWTRQARAQFYNTDQGSRLIPYRWLAALKEPDGRPFLRDQLRRYHFLPRDAGDRNPFALPIGFTVALDDGAVQTGINCAACHTRQITAGGKSYRIDGGPAIVDFENFFTDLDAAVRHTLADPKAFAAFKRAVERGRGGHGPGLLKDLLEWYVPYHALIAGSLPKRNMWGLGRVDAISIIFNRLTGIDIGERPGHLIPQNIHPADAPVRFPFLWNAPIQDFTQWAGITPNGNTTQGLSRNLGEVYGVFAIFHPKKDASQPSGYDWLIDNSANWTGLETLESLVDKMGPPKWPWSVNTVLAQAGAKVYAAECASCHGIQPGLPRPPVTDTWATPVQNVGTDTREWRVVLRLARTGVMEGATLPGGSVPLAPVDLAARILTTATQGAMTQKYPGIVMAPEAPLKPNSYESRVLEGIWAAPPYLHNGSVPSMADLLKPARERPTSFEVGPAYDPDTLGLAQRQPQGRRYLRILDDCRDLDSGNSNCGHEFGTRLPEDAKKALLEYIKTL